MCAIPIHTFFTIVFCLFATFLQICNAAENDSIFWLFSNEGSLRRNAPSGTVVQFDGPIRINPALSEKNLVNLHLSEPFLLRQHFNITPSSSIMTGQSFKLILTRPLLPQYSKHDFIKLTIQAQIMPNSINNDKEEKQQIVMKIEEKELNIKLFGDADGQNEAEEKLANGMLHKRIHMKRDDKNCKIYKIEPIATRKQHFASPSYKLICLYNKFFQIHNGTSSIDDSIKIVYNGPAKCAPQIAVNDGKLQILASFLNSFGSPEFEIWSLESEKTEEEFSVENGIHFIQKEFYVEFQPSLLVLKPQLILLSELKFLEINLVANNNSIEFKLEANETIDDILNINPQTGALSINDSERLLTLFESNEESIQMIVFLLLNGKIMDRAIINLRIDEQNWKGPRKNPNELIKFERSIYAFAIDPYNLNKFGDGNEEQILFGKLETKPKMNEENENLVEFIISEGGGGLFKFANSKNGSTKNSLIYSGPMSQFPRNYTLKVILISNDEFVDTAIVHILIAGIGSSPPTFQRPFQRIMVSKYKNDFFAESPQQNDSKELFTLSADDTDPDAHLTYALEGMKCRNFKGKILLEFECKNAFLLSPNGTTGQWVLSLMENANGGEHKQQISEALMNISVRDEAHSLEKQANTLLLLKFIQKLNSSYENEANNSSNNFEKLLETINKNLTLHLLDSMPVNSVIYSFGGLPTKMGKLPTTLYYYSLSGQLSKYFSIGRESGILSIALPLRNIIGRYQLSINVLNKSNVNEILYKFNPILEIASSIKKWHRLKNYYELEDGKFVNLGQEFANTFNDIELLMPSINGTNGNGRIKADENGTVNLAPIFDTQFSEDRSSNSFAVFNKTNIDISSSIISIHREIPSPSTNSLSFSNMPISSLPSSPIRLPENSPIGTYVLSLDFNTPPQTSEFIIRPTSKINSTIEFLSIERKANSILLRTNQPLKGIMMDQNTMEFILQQNGKEIGKFSVEIIPITNCQPCFKRGQKLVLSIREEQISNHQQSDDVSIQWFPIGTILAEMATKNSIKECNSIKYSIVRIGRNEEDNLKLESTIQIDSHTGMISVNPLILSVENIFEGIPLTILAQSGPKYAERIRIQLKIIRQIPLDKNSSLPKFIGKSPILLEIEEGIPVGTLLTTLKAYSDNGMREIQKYRLEGPDTDLLEIDPTNGELKTKHELDYERLMNDRQLPLQMLAIAEGEEGGENAAEMEIRLNIIDINDNFPEFSNSIYDFVVEKDVPIGWQLGKVEAEDADPKNVTLRILTCDFHFGRFSRQIFPTNRIFKLDPSNGVISLASSVDDSTGGHFILQLEAEDDSGRRSKQNGTVNIWVVNSADIVTIVIHKSAVQLDAKELNEYMDRTNASNGKKNKLKMAKYSMNDFWQPKIVQEEETDNYLTKSPKINMESTEHQNQQQITAITVEPGTEMNSGGAGRRMAGTSNGTSVDERRPKKDSQYAMGATDDAEPYGICAKILIVLSYILTIITFPISVFMCIKIVQQYEHAVIFRLGQLKKGGAKGPGLFFIIPCIDEYRKVDLRVVSFQVPPQEILSKDSVTVEVDAVVYFRVKNATISIVNVENATGSTKLLAQTTLRNVLGIKTLSEMLSDREHISAHMQEVLDEATENWGVKVERVEVKDIRLPREMQRAMAAEAEAAREAKAKVIAAEGEQKASRALREAAMIISETPTALQLRYLQTLGTIAAEHNSTIVFPVPVDMMASFMQSSGYGGHGRPHGYAPQTPQQMPLLTTADGQPQPPVSQSHYF